MRSSLRRRAPRQISCRLRTLPCSCRLRPCHPVSRCAFVLPSLLAAGALAELSRVIQSLQDQGHWKHMQLPPGGLQSCTGCYGSKGRLTRTLVLLQLKQTSISHLRWA